MFERGSFPIISFRNQLSHRTFLLQKNIAYFYFDLTSQTHTPNLLNLAKAIAHSSCIFAMDHSLRCNSLKCRTLLDDRAVVTTCSHIFCEPCAESLGLANPNGSARVCPACETHLSNPDDAVVTQLNPTEDYKTSVLSGLSPSIIMECAGRGMAFYTYQTAQEM